jgi:hypothetical protein
MRTTTTPTTLPRLPQMGRRETYYVNLARRAQEVADAHLRAAAKVGQYITIANNPALEWEAKVTHYQHALNRHCVPPPWSDDETWLFYRTLANLVRQHAGQVALRLASGEDDLYAARLAMGQDREKIEDDAEAFFARLIPAEGCPEWFTEDDYATLKLIRDQWI